MRRNIASGLIAAMVLAGCGDGDGGSGDSEAPAVGYLAAGGAQGVRYQTATRSGYTDASGSFRYMPGETVRFSVGAIELGSAPGANRITLFTLAGAAQPTTEAALRRELDRALRVPTPFLRAVNLARFLMVFDSDGIPENGLDVSAAGTALANASLDFGQGMFVFTSRLESLPHPKTENIPYWRPVAHLYRVENVAVSAHVPLRVQLRDDSFLSPSTDATYTYRHDGLRESLAQDVTLDGVPDYTTAVTYDAMGRPASSRQQLGGFIGGNGFVSMSTYEYDSRGRFLRQDNETDVGNDGTIDSASSSEIEGGPADDFIRQTFRTDDDADGEADLIEVYEFSLDRTLLVQTSTSRIDADADGIFDFGYREIASFDERERIATRAYESDDDGDGLADSRRMTVFTYTDSPRTARSEESIDYEGDGIADRIIVIARDLDEAGNDLTRRIADDYDGDGTVDFRSTQASTFDTERRRLTTVDDQDYTGDGIIDHRLSESQSFAPSGGLLTYRAETDFLADGVIDLRREQRYEYGTGGELLGWGYYDPDLSPTEPSSWMAVENIGFADGVRALAQSYFEFGGAVTPF
jgi:hypothetical protein